MNKYELEGFNKRLTLFDKNKNKTCCVDFMKDECFSIEAHCSYCTTNDKVWDKLRYFEEMQELGRLIIL